jgi:hypothetical protein
VHMREASEHSEEKHTANSLPDAPKVGVFYTGKLWGGLAKYRAHYDLSCFMPLLRGNSPTSSGLILKMNICYKWVSRELEKIAWSKREIDLSPSTRGVGVLL